MKRKPLPLVTALAVLALLGLWFILNPLPRGVQERPLADKNLQRVKDREVEPAQVPEVFSRIGQPSVVKPFPRGAENQRRHQVPKTREVPRSLLARGAAVMAMTPADGRLRLLPEETDLHTRRARRMVLDVSALDRVVAGQTARLIAPTPGGEVLTLRIHEVKTRSAQSHTLLGRVEGEEETSDVLLVYHDGILHGELARYGNDQHIEYRILTDGHLMVRELDPATMTADCGKPGEPEGGLSDEGIGMEIIPQEDPGTQSTAGWTTIDAVVGYDKAARIADGGVPQIEARIIASVDRMTTAFANSLVTQTELMLLGTIEDPAYVFPGDIGGSMSSDDELGNLNSLTDGVLDAVSGYATQLGADLKCFVVKQADGSAGIAYLPGNSSIVARDYMTSSRITFAHELGHNIGCDHSWGDSSQAYHFRYGWRLSPPNATNVRTIMAYDWNWGNGTRIPYFSNPAVSYLGAATGAADGYNVINDATADPRYFQGGLGYTGSDPNRYGFDGNNAALGARNADLIKNGSSNSSHGATFASNRANRNVLAVTRPAAGAEWVRGENQSVFFTGGDMQDTSSVLLFKGGVLQSTIATGLNAATKRTVPWTIPNNLPAGSDYMIRVTLAHPGGGGSSADSGFFTITGGAPRVVAQAPEAATAVTGTLSQIAVTFTQPMNPASFSTSGDILSFTGPQGVDLDASITGATWDLGNTRLTIAFAAQSAAGYYRMVFGPEIGDMVGELLDQDRDEITGEAFDDTYAAHVRLSAASTASVTIWSDLVGADAADAGWTFSGGTWAEGNPLESPPSGPNAGFDGNPVIGQNLSGNYNKGENSYAQSPVINCSTHANVTLSFRGWKGAGRNDQLYVDAWDGETWRRVYSYSGPNGGANDTAWTAYAPSLADYADGNPGFRLRWGLVDATQGNSGQQTGWQIDSIVVQGAGGPLPPPAPCVVSHSPSGAGQTSHAAMWLEFSQPMDTGSFTLGDIVSFSGPAGSISATGFAWIHDSLLRVDFPTQSAMGTYAMVLGPGVLDTFGQPMDADFDNVPGEALDDRHTAQFTIGSLPAAASGLAATVVSSTRIDLTWQDNSSNETGFKLQRATNGGGPWVDAALIPADATGHADTGLQPGVTYFHRLAATNGFGDSGFAATTGATTWTEAEQWRDTYFGQTANSGDAANDFDFDGDGQVNLIERAFGTHPADAASSHRPAVSMLDDGGESHLAITYRQIMGGSGNTGVNYVAGGITYTVQYDNDITDPWSEGETAVVSEENDVPLPGIQTVTVRLVSPSSEDRQFIRLSLTEE